MTGHDDFDRTLADWFDADALSPAPAGGLDRVIDASRRRRPRPAWLAGPGSHWVGEAPNAGSRSGVLGLRRFGTSWSTALIVLLIISALLGAALLAGAGMLPRLPLPGVRLGHLAYGLDGDIYVADWDGRNAVRIADGNPGKGPGQCGGFVGEGPMWSPDGRHFAYRSAWDDVCDGKVYISDPEGHVVASFPGTGWLVSWSPDSSRIATWADLDRIGIYGVDGERQALLESPTGSWASGGDFDPELLSDGDPIVIRVHRTLWEAPAGGGISRALPRGDPRGYQGVLSPVGDHVASVESGSLVVAAKSGSERRVVVSASLEFNPMWSPTGDRIAFVERSQPIGDSFEGAISIVDVASGAVTRLASVRGTGPSPLLRFSPEGDRILFWRVEGGVPSLWSVNADGSNARLLVTGADWGDWQWQPGGTR